MRYHPTPLVIKKKNRDWHPCDRGLKVRRLFARQKLSLFFQDVTNKVLGSTRSFILKKNTQGLINVDTKLY